MRLRRGSDAAYLPVRYAVMALADLTEAHLVGTLAATRDEVPLLDEDTAMVPFAGVKPKGLRGTALVNPAEETRRRAPADARPVAESLAGPAQAGGDRP